MHLDHAGGASTLAADLLARARRGELGRNELTALMRHAVGRGAESADRGLAIAVLYEHLLARQGSASADSQPVPGSGLLRLQVATGAAVGGGSLAMLFDGSAPVVFGAAVLALLAAAAVRSVVLLARARGPPALLRAILAVGGMAKIARRAPAEVVRDLQRFVDEGDRAALITVMTAGLAREPGDTVLARFSERHGLGWSAATRGELLRILPTRKRVVRAVAMGTAGSALLAGGFAVFGGFATATAVAGALGAVAISATVLRLVPDTLRVRGPTASRVVAATAGLSIALLGGIPLLSGVGVAPLVAAGAAVGAGYFAVRRATSPVPTERTGGPGRLARAAVRTAVIAALAAPMVAGAADGALGTLTVTGGGAHISVMAGDRAELPRTLLVQRHDVLSGPVAVALTTQFSDTPAELAALFGVSRSVFAADNPALVARGWDAVLPVHEQITVRVRGFDGVVTVGKRDNLDYYARLFNRPDYGSIVALNPGRFRDPDRIYPGERIRVLPAVPAPRPEQPQPGQPGQSQPGQPGQSQPESQPGQSQPPVTQPGPGLPWTALGVGGLIVLGAVGAFFGVRALLARGRALRGALRGFPAVFTGWGTPMPAGAVRTGLRVGSTAGAATGLGLILLGGGVVATVTGLVVTAASILAAVRSVWSPIRIRAPTWGEVVAVAVSAAGLQFWPTQTGLIAYAVWGAVDLVLALKWATGRWAKALAGVNVLNWAVFVAVDLTAARTSDGLASPVGGVSFLADLGFLVVAVALARAVWAGRADPSAGPEVRWILRLFYPLLTLAVAGLGVLQYGAGGWAAVLPVAPVVVGFGYLTWRHWFTAPGRPVGPAKRALGATVAAALGLLGHGLGNLAVADRPTAAVTAGVFAMAGAWMRRGWIGRMLIKLVRGGRGSRTLGAAPPAPRSGTGGANTPSSGGPGSPAAPSSGTGSPAAPSSSTGASSAALRPATLGQLRAAIQQQRDRVVGIPRFRWTADEFVRARLLVRLEEFADELAAHQPGSSEYAALLTEAHTGLARLDQLTNPTPPTGGTGNGGAVAIGGLSERQRLLLVRVLPLLAAYLRALEELTGRMPRGPPGAPSVLVLDLGLDRVGSVLRAAGLTGAEIVEVVEVVDALRRLVMFGWRDGTVVAVPEAAGGVAIITRAMLEELLEHEAAGRLSPGELDGLWIELLGHELEFHLGDLPEHTGDRHDAHAARFAEALRAARARWWVDEPELSLGERRQWAEQLFTMRLRMIVDGERALVVHNWVQDTEALLVGEGLHPHWPSPPAVVFHRRASAHGAARPGGATAHWDGATLHVVAAGPVEAMVALVEGLFAGWAEFGPEQARVAAVVAGAVAVSGRARSYIPSRARDHQPLRRRLADVFADWSAWRELALAFADEVRAADVVTVAGAQAGPRPAGTVRPAGRPAAGTVGSARRAGRPPPRRAAQPEATQCRQPADRLGHPPAELGAGGLSRRAGAGPAARHHPSPAGQRRGGRAGSIPAAGQRRAHPGRRGLAHSLRPAGATR